MPFGPVNVTPPFFPLPAGVKAITLWPFVFYRRGYEPSPALQAHEEYHWRQALRWGVVPWYAAYVVLAMVYRTGGRGHPLEASAYAAGDRAWRRLPQGRGTGPAPGRRGGLGAGAGSRPRSGSGRQAPGWQ